MQEESIRRCSRCREEKPTTEFHRRPDRAGGLTSHCKACAAVKKATYYQENRAVVIARSAAYRRQHSTALPRPVIDPGVRREREAAYHKRYRAQRQQQYPDLHRAQVRASVAVHRALECGVLVKPTACEWCGQARAITAAHHDYSKPLDVRWLCYSCHSKWDHAEPKLFR